MTPVCLILTASGPWAPAVAVTLCSLALTLPLGTKKKKDFQPSSEHKLEATTMNALPLIPLLHPLRCYKRFYLRHMCLCGGGKKSIWSTIANR